MLIRGLPGSGKSTLARGISREFYGNSTTTFVDLDNCISEADSYFLTGSEENGTLKYTFNADQLPKAHQLSFEKVCRNIRNGLPIVIASNTFTQYWELYNYIKAAYDNNYLIFVIDTSSPSVSDSELERRNVHGVDKSKISAMRKRFQSSKVGLWSDEDVIDFLIDNNRSVIQGRYLGVYIDLSAILDSAVVMTPLLSELPIAELTVAMSNLRKRNSVRNHVGDNTYHLTVLPPSLSEQVSEDQRKQLLQIIYHSVVITVDGCGYVKDTDSSSTAIYLTVDEAGLQPIRSWMHSCGLNADEWYPHITIGFSGSDIHGVPKPKMFPFPTDELSCSKDETDLCRCLLHPSVKMKAKTSIDGIEFVDVSVQPVPGIGDDLTYSKNPELLALVPRGLVYARIAPPLPLASDQVVVSSERWVCVLRGITKFTGTMGNDDDLELVDAEAAALLTNLCGAATHFRTSAKENGRAGGFSVVYQLQLDPERYLVCVGTKLSHLLVSYDVTSNSFELDPAWRVDPNMRMLVRNIEAYQDIFSRCQRVALFARLSHSPAVTLNCEVLDYEDQHIERLPDGCLTAVCLNIVGRDGRYDTTLLSELQLLGLRTVAMGPLKPIEEFTQEVRRMKAGRKEGYVVQFLDSSGAITSLLKVKCLWYIVVRAIREATKSKLLSGSRNPLADRAKDIESKVSTLEEQIKEFEYDSEQRDGCLKQYTALKGIMDKNSQLKKTWYTQLADKAYESIRSSWKTKFDFVRADVDDFTAEKTDRVIELAGSFFHWFARKLDDENNSDRSPCDTIDTSSGTGTDNGTSADSGIGGSTSGAGSGSSGGTGGSTSGSGDGATSTSGGNSSGNYQRQHHGKGEDEKKENRKADFTSTFPIIWDEFVADGFDESFLLLSDLI